MNKEWGGRRLERGAAGCKRTSARQKMHTGTRPACAGLHDYVQKWSTNYLFLNISVL